MSFKSKEEYSGFCQAINEQIFTPKNNLVQFIRTNKGNPVGVVIAYKTDNKIYIGWSLCNTKVEKFDKQIGLYQATNRADLSENLSNLSVLPHSVRRTVGEMKERANRYFNKDN